MNPAFIGIWTFKSQGAFEDDIIFQIFEDGRLAQFFRQHAAAQEHVVSTMHVEQLEGGQFRVRVAAELPGYQIRMRLEADELVIENRDRVFRCRRVTVQDLPHWYSEKVRSAVWR